jgi:hypothetical protein
MLVGETHHCSLHAQASLSTNHPNDVRHSRAGSRRHHLHNAVVAMKVRLRVACRYTHNRMGREVTRCLRADIRRVETRALEELLVSPSVAKAS